MSNIKKIKTILIANRGEIAIRIIKTCREMGIKTIALYTEVELDLPHAQAADISINLGNGSLKETYLNAERIIKIALEHNACAIHPGYGFLSENEKFCHLVEQSGLIFIGPSVESIRVMGDKKTSKIYAGKFNLPLIPGYHGDNQEPEKLKIEAAKIGYPVLIKASAGGGGKGMKVVHQESEFLTELDSAKREAMNAFGSDIVLIEKYILNPRHIEVQVFSDTHGNHFHFYERECSIQRRHQKIIEETPSTALTAELREKICQSAVSIAKGINYRGAGTVEFILDIRGDYFFLEMNTRLQVEHPITEMVTGFDLVRQQILVAEGRAFDFKQSDIKQNGHAFEVRIYAENPDNDFLPTIGNIKRISAPSILNCRLDTGYKSGNDVSINFDPMLAKLITHASTREQNIQKMNKALDEVGFNQVVTNIDYLKRIFKHPAFHEGKTYTNFVQTYEADLRAKSLTSQDKANALASYLLYDQTQNNESTKSSSTAWSYFNQFRN